MYKALDAYNPISIAVYFLAVAAIVMLCANPIMLCMALCGAAAQALLRRDVKHARQHLLYWGIFAATALLNPLFSHNGATVLIVIGNAPISLESLLWGVSSACAILSVLYLFATFSAIMQSDKLLYLFGKLSPRISLILSMALRYVSLLRTQAQKIRQTQTALGLYKQENVIDRVRGGLRIFWILVGWALENGIVTAGSMAARGYGTGKRTHFSRFTFSRRDALLIGSTVALLAGTAVPFALGALDFTFYPTLQLAHAGAMTYLGYACFGAMVALPILIETEDAVKWKYLQSKI